MAEPIVDCPPGALSSVRPEGWSRLPGSALHSSNAPARTGRRERSAPVGDQLPCLSADPFLDLTAGVRVLFPLPGGANERRMEPTGFGIVNEPGGHVPPDAPSAVVWCAAPIHDLTSDIDSQSASLGSLLLVHGSPRRQGLPSPSTSSATSACRLPAGPATD